MRHALLTLVTTFLLAASAFAAEPDVATIVKKMKQGLQGPDNAIRLSTLKVNSNGITTAEWNLAHRIGIGARAAAATPLSFAKKTQLSRLYSKHATCLWNS
jgi:hypothetical protein